MMESGCEIAVFSLQLPMLKQSCTARAMLDRSSIVDFLRRMITSAEALPHSALYRRRSSPAGIALELWVDREPEADLYSARLAASIAANSKPTRIYVLNQDYSRFCDDAVWGDDGCDASQFHSIIAEAGLHAAYPFRPHVWLALDLDAAVGVQLTRSAADLPAWHAGAPLRQHLHWLLRARRQRLAHAASLGRKGRGILLLGHGGAGKSGCTLAGLAAGLQTVGDDYLALGGLTPPVARPLFRVVKQDRAGLARLARLPEHVTSMPENWKNKIEFDPSEIFPNCFADMLEICAIVLPRVIHAPRPVFAEVGGGEAMRALMRSNLFQFPGEPEDGMEYYAALLRQVPTYRLDLSDSAADNGASLSDFIDALC
jgi:hypothetical protein